MYHKYRKGEIVILKKRFGIKNYGLGAVTKITKRLGASEYEMKLVGNKQKCVARISEYDIEPLAINISILLSIGFTINNYGEFCYKQYKFILSEKVFNKSYHKKSNETEFSFNLTTQSDNKVYENIIENIHEFQRVLSEYSDEQISIDDFYQNYLYFKLLCKKSLKTKIKIDNKITAHQKVSLLSKIGVNEKLIETNDVNQTDNYIFLELNVYKFNLRDFYKELENTFDVKIEDYSNTYFGLNILQLDEFIEKYIDFASIKAYTLPRIGNCRKLKWDSKLLQQYADFISWHALHRNPSFKLDFDIIEKFKDKLNWSHISSVKYLSWDLNKLVKYRDYIIFSVKDGWEKEGINKLGKSYSILHVSDDWITKEKFEHLKGSISLSTTIKWDEQILDELLDYWDWDELSSNDSINWSSAMIEKYIDRLNFKILSKNINVDWSEKLLNKYFDKWDWSLLSCNPKLPWSTQFINRYEKHWVWNSDFDWYHNDLINNYPCLSKNTGITWTVELLREHYNKVDIWLIALFGNITNEAIYRYSNELDEKHLIGWKHHRYSDWRATEEINRTGWENLPLNPNFKLDIDLIQFCYLKHISITKGDDDYAFARDENYITKSYRVLYLLRESKTVDISLMELLEYSETWTKILFDENFLNDSIYDIVLSEISRN